MKAEGRRQKERARGGLRLANLAWCWLVTSSFILHPSSFARAEHPFITDDAGTQGKGNWQLELQYEYGRNDATTDAGAGPVRQLSQGAVFTTVLTYGLLKDLDIALGLSRAHSRVTENGVVIENEKGMADSALELKWRFYESNGFSLALKPGLLLPTGDADTGLGTGKLSWGVNFIATYEVNAWTLLANAAYTRLRFERQQDADASRSDIWRVSGGLAYAVSEEVKLVGEIGARANESRDDPFLPGSMGRFAMLGLIYSPTEKIDLDVGLRRRANSAEIDSVFLLGVTVRW